MRQPVVFETVESRKLLSASVAPKAVNVIGATDGVVAASATPSFDQLSTTSHADPTDPNSAADLDTAIKITIVPADGHGGVDNLKLVRAAVRLTNLDTNTVYTQSQLQRVKTSGGGDIIVVQPNDPFTARTHYRLEINGSFATASQKVRDVQGTAFAAFTGTFTTGTFIPTADPTINFTKAVQSAAGTRAYVATTIGPDHKLYASTTDGYIYRYTIGSDGTLSGEQQITTVRDNNGGPRIITGITFDPHSTASNLVLWVSHNQYRFGNDPTGSDPVQQYADNFTGKISVISGPNLADYQDKIVNIPRSVKDHMNNQIVFDPKGKNLYFGIAGLNAMGAADSTWGGRVENIYSASITRAVVGSLNTWVHDKGPVNLGIDGDPNTATGLVAGTTHYNIFKGSNPVRLFATGVRNAFDMVFDRNGHLYADINGSSAGGNVPATPAFANVPINNRIDKDEYKDKNGNYLPYTGPKSAGLTDVRQTEEDALLNVKEGSYYGHPNPARGEYIFDGANPTAGSDNDPFEIAAYPDGQKTDRNYTLPAYDYGTNFSPDGIIQYTSVGRKNKNLDGFLIAARYSGGSDLLALKPNANGSIDTSATQERINGFTKLDSPLDVVEDMSSGNLYVTNLESDLGPGSITLLKAAAASNFAPEVTASTSKLSFNVKPGRGAATRQVTITNTGNADLTFDPTASRISGSGRKNFLFVNFPTQSTTIVQGASLSLTISGQLLKGQTSTVGATLLLKTNDTSLDGGYVSVLLRATNANA